MTCTNEIEMYPETIFPKSPEPALRIFIDNLKNTPSEEWTVVVRKTIKAWVNKTEYRGNGTVWYRGNSSFSARYGSNSWAEYIVAAGFKATMMNHLFTQLRTKWGDGIEKTREMVPEQNQGWIVLCHVEDENIYVPVDAITWAILTE